MNLILKIIQGPNAGAEIALVEGINVKLGKSEDCDVVLNDQSVPDVACEIEVGSDRVMLLLPGGGQERLEPLHVKVFETTAIAIGPGDAPWGQLIWPDPEVEQEEEPKDEEPEEAPPPPPPRFRKLQISLLVTLIVVVVLEFLLWFFWPSVDNCIKQARDWCKARYEKWTKDETEHVAKPITKRTLNELARSHKLDPFIPAPHSNDKPRLEGNVRTRAERLKVTAEAYDIRPGVVVQLTDDETFRSAVQEVLNMLTPNKLTIESAENRELVLSGMVPNEQMLKRLLTALKEDVPYISKIDCTKIETNPDMMLVQSDNVDVRPVAKQKTQEASTETETSTSEDKSTVKKLDAKLPVVGIIPTPYPCVVTTNGSRIMEGGEFQGYIVEKIGDDFVILKKGKTTYKWRP